MAAAKKSTKSAPAAKKAAPPAKAAAASAPAKRKAAAKTAAATSSGGAKRSTATKAPTAKARATKADALPTSPDEAAGHDLNIPAPRGTTKDGIAYTKDFDAKFLKLQKDALLGERAKLVGQAVRLEDEANSLIEEGEMGDVQFDDESGEGDTMVVERERDLALSAQARQTVNDIDDALARIAAGTYGYSLLSGAPIPRERLEAIPWATELVEEKVGGIGRR
jgi:RNA polymerase-binding transcription factor